jgi:hypothetical protein
MNGATHFVPSGLVVLLLLLSSNVLPPLVSCALDSTYRLLIYVYKSFPSCPYFTGSHSFVHIVCCQAEYLSICSQFTRLLLPKI